MFFYIYMNVISLLDINVYMKLIVLWIVETMSRGSRTRGPPERKSCIRITLMIILLLWVGEKHKILEKTELILRSKWWKIRLQRHQHPWHYTSHLVEIYKTFFSYNLYKISNANSKAACSAPTRRVHPLHRLSQADNNPISR